MNIEGLKKRMLNSIVGNKDMPNIVFLHVPKCGGTSIDTSIKNEYLTLDVRKDNIIYKRIDSQKSAYVGGLLYGLNFEDGDPRNNRNMAFNRDFWAYQLAHTGVRYFSGHFPFDFRVYNEFERDQFNYITILRDPVEKWLSNYYYRSKRKPSIRGRKINHWLINEDIESYLNSKRGEFHGYDYAKYFGGIRDDYDYKSKEAIENAKNNLKQFKVVGFLDDINQFKKDFKNEFKVNLKIKHRNQSRQPKQKIEISDDILQRIKQVCSTDIEIYNFAKEYFVTTK